jgi:hypothetical protein
MALAALPMNATITKWTFQAQKKVLVMPTVGFVAAYRRAAHPIGSKMKNADVPTVNREAEENWGK